MYVDLYIIIIRKTKKKEKKNPPSSFKYISWGDFLFDKTSKNIF